MSQQYPQNPNPQQPFQPGFQPQWQPPKKKHTGRNIFLAMAGVVVVMGIAASFGGSPSGTPSVSETTLPNVVTTTKAKPAATTAPPAPAYGKPAKGDFTLTAKVLTKQCFGSAGCSLTFRILISYTGPTLDPSKSYDVLYEVRGGSDGPLANKFTVTGDQSSVDTEESISTSSKSSKLTALVTDVL
jgi:hypothetical protein